jgi:geranylgeranyl reductase family protein
MGEFDVVIIGAGPAGSVAAHVLAGSGRRVAVADRAVFPRSKLCGGLLTWKSVRLLETTCGLDLERLRAEKAVHHQSSAYFVYGSGSLVARGQLPFPFHFSDRSILDRCLLDVARQSGAQVFEGCRAVDCEPNAGTVICADGTVLRGKFIIGADGVNSVVRRHMPFFGHMRGMWRSYLAPAMEARIPADRFPRRVIDPELHVGRIRDGYGWVFPGNDHVLAGICGLRRSNGNFTSLFRDFIRDLGVADPESVHPGAYPLPYGNYCMNPCHGRAMLAGDAGGFVEPFLGEGIFFAMATGYCAARAIADNGDDPVQAAAAYQDMLNRQILPEIRGSDRLRCFLFHSITAMGTGWLSLFMRIFGSRLAQTVHGMRSYAWTRAKQWDFLG